MFVPLTEYHGGGAEATIEPLREHLPHYERRLKNLFGAGVQACFRGPRIYDAPETKEMVSRWVGYYKEHREILDSSLIPLRRADGRDWDGWIHVNPRCQSRAMAAVYNPTSSPITTSIAFPLYYSGISESAKYRFRGEQKTEDDGWKSILLDRRENAKIEVTIPSQDAIFVEFAP